MTPKPNSNEKLAANGHTSRSTKLVQVESKQNIQEVKEQNTNSKILDTFSKLLFWSENEDLDKSLRKLESKLPKFVGPLLASLGMFVLGITARGEWALFTVYFLKYLQTGGSENYVQEGDELINGIQSWMEVRFKGYISVLIPSVIISYVAYFGIGGYLHWFYYVKQRDNPETWKCQPKKWLSPALERHEIMIGSVSLIFGSAISAAISTYVLNGGWSMVYFGFGDYGYIWLILQVPIVFIYQDYLTYWHHRIYHTPWLYKNFHKLHHTYKQPTSFSVTAIHPVEFMHMQTVLISPMFFCPVHWLNFSIIMMYTYYHGIIDHSGINFKRHWWQPWQPDCIFHDNHHQYFHVNFGFNIEFWDHLHGTYRRKDRIYREDIYYGQGKGIEEASREELEKDIEERESENPLAYRNNQREFDLDKEQILKN